MPKIRKNIWLAGVIGSKMEHFSKPTDRKKLKALRKITKQPSIDSK